jgi:transcription factor SPN1
MKNPKAAGLTDQQKDIMVEKLQIQMAKAVKLDNEMYAQQQPAVYKMQLLETVRTTISMKPLHQTLLDKDILANLRDWIEPRDSNTLPALSVRTTVYELLMQLPCLPDHLKRSNGEKPPIGMVIVALRKHKMETPANKRLLKELMDKWSRPIFSKSADVRVGSGAGVLPTSDHPEVQEAILQRYLAQKQRNASHGSSSRDGEDGGRTTSSQRSVGFGNAISGGSSAGSSGEGDGEPKKAPDLYTRARTPYNTGFLFTVQPELKNIDKRNVMEKSLGEGRMKLFKKMSESSGGGNKGLGKKANPR